MQQYRPTGFSILPPVVKNLLIINGILYLATSLTDWLPLEQYLALHFFTSPNFMPHQFVTYMFMHGPFYHILFNMLALWMFGAMLENYWGAKKFLVFYMVTGLGAGATHVAYTGYKLYPAYTFSQTQDVEAYSEFVSRNKGVFEILFPGQEQPAEGDVSDAQLSVMNHQVELLSNGIANIPVVGASGAIFGILLAFGMLFPNSIIYLYFFIPMKAKYFVILYGVIELSLGVAERPGDHVAHFAHLGGMIFGFLLIRYWQRKSRSRFY